MVALARVGAPGQERPYAVEADTWYPLEGITTDINEDFFSRGGFELVRRALADGVLTGGPRPADRLGAPIARPAAVVCIGMNYAAHAAESGGSVPDSPVVFFKHPNTVVGPDDDVELPPGSRKLDYEVELGIVIGQRALYLPDEEAARGCIAGYALSNDVSERAHQIEISGGQWSKGKSSPTFNPLGPFVVAADDVDVRAAHLWTRVNGEVRQDSTTADMIFSPVYLVWYLSQFMALEPGDLITTGTPSGVALSGRFPFLQLGDVVELGLDGLGTQRQRIVTHRE